MSDYKAYAGIGSRQTPPDMMKLLSALAYHLANQGWTLRSGAADGADTACEQGAFLNGCAKREIFIPWNGFNKRRTENGVFLHDVSKFGNFDKALGMARKHHPNWNACSYYARSLHARNCYQVLGQDLNTPIAFILCWTPKGSGNGGTGQAIRLARAHGITVNDLGNPKIEANARAWLDAIVPVTFGATG